MTLPVDPTHIEPPDDTGSDTFARFRFQARATFPYCLNMLLQGFVRSVIPEHIEDIAVEYESDWIFMQVKTRDAPLGPWRLAHLLNQDGGLRSLWRSHEVLEGAPARLQLLLEGSVARNDPAEELLAPNENRSAELCRRVADRLSVQELQAAAFLARVTIREIALRRSIRAENLDLIAVTSPGLTTSTAAAIHDGIVDRVCDAMARDIIGDAWPKHVVDPRAAPNDVRARVNSKRITVAVLQTYQRLMTPPPRSAYLLRSGSYELAQPGRDATDLTRKLSEAGATSDLIERAKHLRAAATRHEFELFAKTLEPRDRRLDDLHERLITEVVASTSLHRGQLNAAAHVFKDLLASVHANRASLDPNSLFAQDPMLLLGEICELSDQCRTDWGA